ncbi:DUF4186 domain-containing protein [Salinisphaera sp. Q1T1-3]|uniref:DUF4186 domain-containing protein n=1 Tax=Salinisphaera sp. Q1T1-3 TaxID=2321229 RepID=UPI000E7099FA|nr:DUF4186 domain-containing protein [Salinisphaera sp. Q1T1-3]RJS91978.1 DUF4186 domain-containing protein [Salinisphaera sp. Q1T1-3]
MRDRAALFARLARSHFRSRFRLGAREQHTLDRHGPHVIRAHAADFVATRLAPANPPDDGRQTPMRNHPVFIAQHATATCCRGCLAKWHGLPPDRALDAEEQAYICDVIMDWLAPRHDPTAVPPDPQRSLF